MPTQRVTAMPRNPRLTETKTRELVSRAQDALLPEFVRREARAILLRANEGLIVDIASGRLAVVMRGRKVRIQPDPTLGLEHEDLVQAGCLGFLEAVERFDLTAGTKFSTYSARRVMWGVEREIREARRVRKDIGPEPAPSDRTSRPLEQVPDSEGGGDRLDRMVRVGNSHFRLSEILRQFDGQTRQLVALRFGLGGYAPHTPAQIARVTGLPLERVGETLREGLEKFRDRRGCGG